MQFGQFPMSSPAETSEMRSLGKQASPGGTWNAAPSVPGVCSSGRMRWVGLGCPSHSFTGGTFLDLSLDLKENRTQPVKFSNKASPCFWFIFQVEGSVPHFSAQSLKHSRQEEGGVINPQRWAGSRAEVRGSALLQSPCPPASAWPRGGNGGLPKVL